MAKLKGLGKGLDALLAQSKVSLDKSGKITDALAQEMPPGEQLLSIAINELRPGKYQPRRIFNEEQLQELANSIQQNGVIQPLVVRRLAAHSYEIIAGERRWRASQLAGLSHVPAVVRQFSDEEALAVALIENIQRQDLNIVEEAEGYRRLIDEFGLTHEALAQVTGKSRSAISNTLRLLNLNPEVIQLLLSNKIDMGHARALLPLAASEQVKLAHEIMSHKLTTAEVENKVARIVHELKYGADPKRAATAKDPDISSLEQALADKIGMQVQIKHKRNGQGRITIDYSSIDELDAFLAKFNPK